MTGPTATAAGPTIVLVALVTVVGCSGSADERSASAVRDSAGIRIVENFATAPPDTWAVADTPLADIGAASGDSLQQLFRVQDAVRLSDGRIAVANAGTGEIRFYDAGGQHVETAGGQGQGPGEFQRLGLLCRLPGDTLLAWDRLGRRVSVFNPEGGFLRSFALEHPGERTLVGLVGCFEDGTLITSASRRARPSEVDMAPGRKRGDETYVRFSPSGVFIDTVARIPGDASYLWVLREGKELLSLPVPFDHRTYEAVGPSGFHVAFSHRYEVEVYGPDEMLRTIIRAEGTPPEVSESDWEMFLKQRLSGIGDENRRRAWRQRYREVPLPDRMPLVAALEVDRPGQVWVRRYQPPPSAGAPDSWWVFCPDGRLVAAVELPDGFELYDIGPNWLLGKWEDDMEVEHVQLLALERGS